MRVLVTGGAGYLGSVLVQNLLENNHVVTVVDILMFGGESLLSNIYNKNLIFKRGDIRSNKFLSDVFSENFDIIFHLAALVGEPACKIDPSLTESINYKATMRLAKKAKKSGVKLFVFTSTCSNYGVSSPGSLATEESPLRPLSLYAETKIRAEKELLLLNSSKFSVCIMRFATIFGLSPKMRFNLLINEIVRDAYFGKKILLYKENAWRPYTHIQDAAEILTFLLTVDRKKITGEIFNAGTENAKKKDIAQLVKKYISTITIKKGGGLADNRDYQVSFKKLEKVLGLRPKRSIEEGIQEMVLAMKNNLFANPYEDRFNIWLDEHVFE